MIWADIGAPLVVAAIVAFAAAFATRFAWAGFIGALIGVPLCLYLKDMPYLQWVSLTALPANVVAATALWQRRSDIGFAFLLPFMLQTALILILWWRNFPVFTGFRF